MRIPDRILLATLLTALVALTPATPTVAADPVIPPDTPAEVGGPGETVHVHGDWLLEIRDPDGSLVTRRAFRNAFVGGPALDLILSRQGVHGAWFITFTGTPSPC